MEKWENRVGKLTGFLDRIAGIAMIAVMLLVVLNIALREIVGSPILGAYEYVGFITAAVIGLSIAHCAFQNGHIAVGFIMDRFPNKVKLSVDVFVHLFSILFLGLSTLHILEYANSMLLSGEVSPTTRTPFYPFIYLVAVGVGALCLVLVVRMLRLMVRVSRNGR